ncbi:MAG: precorrin-6A reductase [Mogibacterium sp.]|nr:precorrin-6A reductase [Mogibacterium sp.]
MKKPLLFSGTTEGRTLSEKLTASGIAHIVCVATEYGGLVMEPSEFADVRTGRMTALEMYDLMKSEADKVFDATHPYAADVSHNIHTACLAADKEYVRIERDTDSGLFPKDAVIRDFEDAASCARALAETEGNILLTTGSKELSLYAADEDVRSRLYARVLPSRESISLCEEAGLSGKHIIAMQGPFSMETDLALIRQFDIKTLVTKSSGSAGGAPEKIRAAARAGIPVYMIGRPAEETGLSVNEVLAKHFGIRSRMVIDLVGIGPGGKELLTADAAYAIEKADMLFGASRMVSAYDGRKAYPYYKAEDIIPVLEKEIPERAAVLFSGDTGFYSGAEKFAPALREWAYESGIECDVRVHPGISSFAYLAAKAGVSYQDAKLVSIHGCSSDKRAAAELVNSARYNGKTFVLLSGAEDVKLLGGLLMENGLGDVRIILGYQLSYPEEIVGVISAEDCGKVDVPGLYTAILINKDPAARKVIPVISDEEMIRGKVPMTKENIRHLSVMKLGLTEGAVVYDIGSGTGSVACEIAAQSDSIKVYAIEKKEEACSLIGQNAVKFGLSNIEIVQGTAPEALEGLEPPTHAFIGGSSGELKEILTALKNTGGIVRVVMNAVSLETIAEIQSVLKDFGISDLSAEQISVSRSRELGNYHLMTAENPVMIASFTLGGRS